MKRLLFLLVGLVFGIYRELLEFVQRTRNSSNAHKEIQHHEYYELTIPHPAVGKVMDKLYADYIKSHYLNLVEYMDLMIEGSLGSLLPVPFCKPERYMESELSAFFIESDEVEIEYWRCLNGQSFGSPAYECINELIDRRLQGVNRQLAKSATYFLEMAKRIPPSSRVHAFSATFTIKEEEDYLEDLFKYLCESVPRIEEDRKSLMPEVFYALSMLRYFYNLSSFTKNRELSQPVFEMMKALLERHKVLFYSFTQEEHLPRSHAIKINNRIFRVDRIVALGVSQRERLEKDVMQLFIKDNEMYVSFPHYYKDAIASIIETAKKFLLGKSWLSANPTSLPIPDDLATLII